MKTETKRKPATALPFVVMLLNEVDHFGGEQPEIHDCFGRVATVYGEGEEAVRQAAYIAAACNAYPELVAALEEIVRAIIPLATGRRFTPERRAAVEQARALLRKLGESS